MRRRLILLSVTITLLAGTVAATGTLPGVAKPIPSLSELRQAVLRYFRAQRDYRPGDLITQDKVEPLSVQFLRKMPPQPDAKPSEFVGSTSR